VIEFFNKIADKIDEPCWLISLTIVFLAAITLRSARKGAKEEGERAVEMLAVSLGRKKKGGKDD